MLPHIASRGVLPTLNITSPDSPQALLTHTLLGVLFDALLMGVFIVQVTSYYRWFQHNTRTQLIVLVLLLMNVAQTTANIISQFSILARLDNNLWMYWSTRSHAVLISHLLSPFLMGIPHVLLTLQCSKFARSLGTWPRIWRLTFEITLWAGTAVSFAMGLAGSCSLFIQGKIITQYVGANGIDYYALFISINCVTSAIIDVLLACVLMWELRQSRSSFEGSNKLIEGIISTTLSTGIALAIFQVILCGLYVSHQSPALSIIGFTIIGKMYSITSLLIICRPLEIQYRQRAMFGVSPHTSAVDMSSGFGGQRSIMEKVRSVGRKGWQGRKKKNPMEEGCDGEGELGFEDALAMEDAKVPRGRTTSCSNEFKCFEAGLQLPTLPLASFGSTGTSGSSNRGCVEGTDQLPTLGSLQPTDGPMRRQSCSAAVAHGLDLPYILNNDIRGVVKSHPVPSSP